MRFDVPIAIVSQKLWILEILRISCFRNFWKFLAKNFSLVYLLNF